MNRIICYIAFLFTLILGICVCYADDAVIGRDAEGVYPITDNDVVMVSEDIYIDEYGKVKCKFEFENTGDEKNITMGFPATLDERFKGSFGDDDMLRLVDFKTWIGDIELPVTLEKSADIGKEDMKDYTSWYCFDVHFDKNETKIIEHTYKVSFGSDSLGCNHRGYILETGACWKDKIGYAKITFELGSFDYTDIFELSPIDSFILEDNKIIFEFHDIEPDFNIYFFLNRDIEKFNVYYSSDYFLYMYNKREEYFNHNSTNLKEINKLGKADEYRKFFNSNWYNTAAIDDIKIDFESGQIEATFHDREDNVVSTMFKIKNKYKEEIIFRNEKNTLKCIDEESNTYTETIIIPEFNQFRTYYVTYVIEFDFGGNAFDDFKIQAKPIPVPQYILAPKPTRIPMITITPKPLLSIRTTVSPTLSLSPVPANDNIEVSTTKPISKTNEFDIKDVIIKIVLTLIVVIILTCAFMFAIDRFNKNK